MFVYVEWPRVVNLINAGGGDPLCALHRAEGLNTAGLHARGV